MIRYVRIGDAIEEGADQIALYDTVRERFLVFGGACVFADGEDLEDAMDREGTSPGLRTRIRRVVEGGRETPAPTTLPPEPEAAAKTIPYVSGAAARRWLDTTRTRGGGE